MISRDTVFSREAATQYLDNCVGKLVVATYTLYDNEDPVAARGDIGLIISYKEDRVSSVYLEQDQTLLTDWGCVILMPGGITRDYIPPGIEGSALKFL